MAIMLTYDVHFSHDITRVWLSITQQSVKKIPSLKISITHPKISTDRLPKLGCSTIRLSKAWTIKLVNLVTNKQ
jgi:hypothetical protein